MSTSPQNSGGFGIRFSERQNRIVTVCVTCVLILAALVSLERMFGALLGFLGRYSNVLMPPVVGIILAMIAKPVYNAMERLCGGRRIPAVAATTVLVFVPVVAFLWFCGSMLVTQGLRFIEALPDLHRQLTDYLARRIPMVRDFLERYGLASMLESVNLKEVLPKVLLPAGGTAVSIGTYAVGAVTRLLGWAVLPIYTAFFLATRPLGGEDIRNLMVFASPKARENAAFLVDQFLGIVVTFFRGQVVIVVIQGLLYGLGFQLSGLSYGFFIGFILGLLNIVPYLGNIIGLAVTLPLALFGPGGSPVVFWCVVAVFVAVHTLDTYFITPRVMRSQTGLNSFVVIFSLFFWGSVIGGPLGMILAIPLSAFIVVIWRLLQRELLG